VFSFWMSVFFYGSKGLLRRFLVSILGCESYEFGCFFAFPDCDFFFVGYFFTVFPSSMRYLSFFFPMDSIAAVMLSGIMSGCCSRMKDIMGVIM